MRTIDIHFIYRSIVLDLFVMILVLTCLVLFSLSATHTYQSITRVLAELQDRSAVESEVLAQLGNPPPPLEEYAMDNPLEVNEHGLSWSFCEEAYNALQFTTVTAVFNTENKLIQYRTITQVLPGESIWNYRWHRLLRRLRIE